MVARRFQLHLQQLHLQLHPTQAAYWPDVTMDSAGEDIDAVHFRRHHDVADSNLFLRHCCCRCCYCCCSRMLSSIANLKTTWFLMHRRTTTKTTRRTILPCRHLCCYFFGRHYCHYCFADDDACRYHRRCQFDPGVEAVGVDYCCCCCCWLMTLLSIFLFVCLLLFLLHGLC